MIGARSEARGQRGVSIIVPTYREAGNIGPLIERIARTMHLRDTHWEVIVADDRSDDGTVEEALHADRAGTVRVLVREQVPRDLGASVLEALALARQDEVIVMDADGSHRPEEIPRLLERLEQGDADMVIGTRYAAQATIESRWSTARRWGSALARWPARALWPVSDPMTGFFALRRSALEGVTFAPKGYKIAMELALRARLRTAQVPIRFEARRIGRSKMDAREVARIARHMLGLWRWRHPRAGEALCFAAVGASGFVIDLAVYLALSAAGTEHRLARALAFWPAAAWTWAWNRNVTFASQRTAARASEWTRSVSAGAVSATINIGAYAALTTLSPWLDAHRIVALAGGVALGAGVNFALARAWVFTGTAHPPEAEGSRNDDAPERPGGPATPRQTEFQVGRS